MKIIIILKNECSFKMRQLIRKDLMIFFRCTTNSNNEIVIDRVKFDMPFHVFYNRISTISKDFIKEIIIK
jgi:hypothetical protein